MQKSFAQEMVVFRWRRIVLPFVFVVGQVMVCSGWIIAAGDSTAEEKGSKFVDHSLLISSDYPCTWPTHPFPKFQLVPQQVIGPVSPYNIDSLYLDGNTGTQLDTPPHSVARPELKREKSGPFGLAYTDKIEPWQFGGEACVIDTRDLLDQGCQSIGNAKLSGEI